MLCWTFRRFSSRRQQVAVLTWFSCFRRQSSASAAAAANTDVNDYDCNYDENDDVGTNCVCRCRPILTHTTRLCTWSTRTLTSDYSCIVAEKTRNSSGDEIANVNFLYDDIVHALEITIDTCINSTTVRFMQRRFTKFSEITQCNGHYAVQGHSRSPIWVPIESYMTSY